MHWPHKLQRRLSVTGVAAFLCLLTSYATAQNSPEEKLKAIQQQIEQRQKQLNLRVASAEELEQTLKKAELEISRLARELDQTRQQLSQNRQQQEQLRQRQSQLQQQIDQQQTALGDLFRSAYMTGQHDFSKMLLNQENAAKLERLLTYYGYFNKARKKQINRFMDTARELEQVETQLVNNETELAQLLKVQSGQRQLMQSEQQDRQETLAALEKRINTEAAKLEQLQASEQNLVQAIERATARAQRQPGDLNGLSSLKGQLRAPTDGHMRNLFYKRRQGQIRWKGAIFNADSGMAVRAIHDGQVLFSDWLKGFGLVTVLDHGDGYMSLYGYNQALLRDVGEVVAAGERIALVGQSGGQSRPGLYFEIRHKGKPVNPSQWLK
ncbi:Protein ORF73 [Saliniradius amylolyticus]|uniref:Protein ORF73 n=1 Tax=Saliniradius amylolyticus TaxID=2183582 RepID=A0A2S2E6D3_9ALTE|nr:peptidoglycan DD-metalloendopeptidase family protein [Saliniradius amylolyticus]AWL13225.1 Protein ORF73 [Saliniradius amylolyticus]